MAPPPTSAGGEQQQANRPGGARVLPLLASAVEANAAVLGFERAAGRSAMIGISTGVLIETARGGAPLLQGGIEGQALAAVALATLGAAAVAVATTARAPAALGARWREPVVASLTSVRRSNSGVTPSGKLRGLDRAVDDVLRGLSLSLVGGGGAAGAPAAASRLGALVAASAASPEEEEAEEAAGAGEAARRAAQQA